MPNEDPSGQRPQTATRRQAMVLGGSTMLFAGCSIQNDQDQGGNGGDGTTTTGTPTATETPPECFGEGSINDQLNNSSNLFRNIGVDIGSGSQISSVTGDDNSAAVVSGNQQDENGPFGALIYQLEGYFRQATVDVYYQGSNMLGRAQAFRMSLTGMSEPLEVSAETQSANQGYTHYRVQASSDETYPELRILLYGQNNFISRVQLEYGCD